MKSPVIVALDETTLDLAESIANPLDGQIHLLDKTAETTASDEGLAQITRFQNLADHLSTLFLAGHPIIGICASAILIRHLAPFLSSKWHEPPVIAVSSDGKSSVPLLGGHHGGNDLAKTIAQALNGHAAITTASDMHLPIALDTPPRGWRLLNPENVKTVILAILRGAEIILTGQACKDADWLSDLADGNKGSDDNDGSDNNKGSDDNSSIRIVVSSDRDEIHQALNAQHQTTLIYVPQIYTLGVGCARNCPADEMIEHIEAQLIKADISPHAIAGIFSIDLKSDETAIHVLSRHLEAPVTFFTAQELEIEHARLANPSDVVFNEVGCHGVAEGAALRASGIDGQLVIEKTKTEQCTMSIAQMNSPHDLIEGQHRGRLSVIGIGPGDAKWRTAEATRLIAEADELVGYGFYIDLLGPLAAHKQRTDFPLGGEEARCRYALEEAGKGRNIALICSGDAGIYAMGTLVMELLDRDEDEGGVSAIAKRVEVVNAPGITALQAASARIGALIGHDFCAISLSDLLTPREAILKRLHAASEGDFVVALYNPVSKRRRVLLDEARAIFLKHRPASTPVLLASHLGRPDEALRLRDLDDLKTDEVDMMTVVLIGASTSKAFANGDGVTHLYTPRGYAKRIDGQLN